LAEAIFTGLKQAGKDLNNLKQKDLAPVDEFHIRGREETVELAQQLIIDSPVKSDLYLESVSL
jgi:hypothetical protein